MQIDFKKVGFSKKELEHTIDNISIKASLEKKNQKVVLLEGRLSGLVESVCDRCGEEFSMQIDENLSLELYNGEISLENSNNLDIIECFDEKIDIDEIIESEIESIKTDYNYCNKCKQGE